MCVGCWQPDPAEANFFQVRQNRGCLKENFVYASFGSVGLCSTIQFRGINSDYYGS